MCYAVSCLMLFDFFFLAIASTLPAGLQLTRKLLMHLMRQGTGQKQALLASYLDLKGAAAMMPTVYMEAATWGWCWVSTDVICWARQPWASQWLQQLLPGSCALQCGAISCLALYC